MMDFEGMRVPADTRELRPLALLARIADLEAQVDELTARVDHALANGSRRSESAAIWQFAR